MSPGSGIAVRSHVKCRLLRGSGPSIVYFTCSRVVERVQTVSTGGKSEGRLSPRRTFFAMNMAVFSVLGVSGCNTIAFMSSEQLQTGKCQAHLFAICFFATHPRGISRTHTTIAMGQHSHAEPELSFAVFWGNANRLVCSPFKMTPNNKSTKHLTKRWLRPW